MTAAPPRERRRGHARTRKRRWSRRGCCVDRRDAARLLLPDAVDGIQINICRNTRVLSSARTHASWRVGAAAVLEKSQACTREGAPYSRRAIKVVGSTLIL